MTSVDHNCRKAEIVQQIIYFQKTIMASSHICQSKVAFTTPVVDETAMFQKQSQSKREKVKRETRYNVRLNEKATKLLPFALCVMICPDLRPHS